MTTAAEVKVLKAHLALNVKDVEKSIGFYRKMLGIEPSKVRTGYAKFDVENPPLNLTLNQHTFNEQGALSHLGLQVASTEDVLAVRERWAEAGLVTRDEMNTNCCYARQDKTWVHDPDGYEWEVFVVLEDNLAETSMCCVTGEAGQAGELKAGAAGGSCAADPEEANEAAAAAGSCGCSTTASVQAQPAAACCSTTPAPGTLSR
jgi:catechol 2,3-dioxygenase-like lactoylglutathione lyase family enzyme